ncbi:MAG: hypothetical protein JO264_19345 [Acidisphaera sp.]|nr:hypothetical protein [Acidisphaera sp.]
MRWLPAPLESWRAPLIALAVALAAAVAARVLRARASGLAAGGLGMAAGWAAVAGIALMPRSLPARLPLLALGAVAGALVLARLRRGRRAGLIALALLGGWWLAGAPRTGAGLRLDWPAAAVGAAWIGATAWLLGEAEAPVLIAASLALAAALHAVGTTAWPLLALVPGAAALGAAAAPAVESLPGVIGLGAAAAAAALAAGRLTHGRLGAVDVACLAPLATAWLAGRLLPRLRGLRGAAELGSALLALLLVALLAFSAAALAGLR